MKISVRGINLIKEFEGCRLEAYLCPASVWTIGYGHTGTVNGKPISKGMKITQQQADDLLKESLNARYEPSVRKFDGLNQNQYDALVSFCYNLGPNIFTGNLLHAIKAKNWESVADQLLLYNKARVNGVLTELKGLTRRREAERKLFLDGTKLESLDDKEYNKAVQILVMENIIGSPTAWELDKINIKNVPALIKKMSKYVEGKS